MSNERQSRFLLYQTSDGQTRLEVRLENETVWLSQNQMTELFRTTKQNVSLHIRNIFKEGELPAGSVVKEYLTTAANGKSYQIKFYNLDVIISVGYRVKSHRGTQFRIWATQQLRECIVKRFSLDDDGTPLGIALNIGDDLVAKARRVSGLQETTALVRDRLNALIERESARRLARLGGSEPQLRRVPRRQSNRATCKSPATPPEKSR